MHAVFPLMEGEAPAEAIVAECRDFLGWCGGTSRLEISATRGIAVRSGLFLDIEIRPAQSDIQKIREFIVDALAEKLRRE
ncbi:MAG TPA: hypothetical protein VGL91_13435 [Acidobacteriota bacterium]